MLSKKNVFRHPQEAVVTIAVVDKYLRDYEEQTDKNATTYKAFYKVYAGAFRKTHTNSPIHDSSAEKANEIFEKIEMMKGNVTVAKMLKRLLENPNDDATCDRYSHGVAHEKYSAK